MATDHLLPYSSPEAEGIASPAILAFVEAAEQNIDALHSFMLLRHGRVVAEGWWAPYAPDLQHMLFSLSKSYTSTAVGLAVAEGRLSVNDPVLSFFPEDAPADPSDHLKAMRVRHLLSMATGHTEDTTGHLHEDKDGNWVKAFLAQPVERAPGTHFLYNTGATYMLSAIVQKLTGQKLVDYLAPRLFEPLGIRNPVWETCPRGINTGGYGLNVTTGDIARFGQLYLQKGVWQGRRILTEAWVAEATGSQAPFSEGGGGGTDWAQGYGYQFWRCRHGAYRGDGAFGQYCIVMPDQDAVLAITSGVKDMQAVLDLVWACLLPAMGPAARPADGAAQATLAAKLAGLVLPAVQGQATSPLAAAVNGQTFTFPTNVKSVWETAHTHSEHNQIVQALSLAFEGDQAVLTVCDNQGEHRLACGAGRWLKGYTTLDNDGQQPIAASGAWVSPDTYAIKVCFYTTPFCVTHTLRFAQDEVTYIVAVNVGFGPTERPPLVGRRM